MQPQVDGLTAYPFEFEIELQATQPVFVTIEITVLQSHFLVAGLQLVPIAQDILSQVILIGFQEQPEIQVQPLERVNPEVNAIKEQKMHELSVERRRNP